ncbi:MAG: dethiobiotin synthase [Holosporaceae bacterium]|jgi:dethiobiotin synthase|nr:dethiobiotin synthase [Holosporaceae bacterium]
MKHSTNVFVTGTDTNVGKTLISAWLCWHTSADYWKLIQTGEDSDCDMVAKLSPHTKIIPEAYKLKAPLSPYDAAKLENVEIDRNLFNGNLQNTIIEGAGGALVPIGENFFMADLIKMYHAKALIVAQSKLGVINHLLMTAEILKIRNIEILGIVLNGEMEDSLQRTIRKFSGLKILSVIPRSNDLRKLLQSILPPSEILELLR